MRILLWLLGIIMFLVGLVIVPDMIQTSRLERALHSIQPGMTFGNALDRLPGGFGGTIATEIDPRHPCLNSAPKPTPAETSKSDKSVVELYFPDVCPGETEPVRLAFSNYEGNEYTLSKIGGADKKVFTSRDEAAAAVKSRIGSSRNWSFGGTYTWITPQHRSFLIYFNANGTVQKVDRVRVWD